MPSKYIFEARHAHWPTDAPARRAVLRVTDTRDHNSVREYKLTAGEARALVREALRALAFTKIPRSDGQWEATWRRAVDKTIEPLLAVINAILPKERRKNQAA